MATPGRFLTTHVGSLPRPQDLMEIMWAREDGIPLDRAAVDARVCQAVEQVVAEQLKAGVDIVNDGEMPKPSYATYIKDRLTGFGGTGNTFVFQDIEAFPQTKARVFADPGRKHLYAPILSSMGIGHALWSGIHAARLAVDVLLGPSSFAADYSEVMKQQYQQYMQLRQRYYRMDRMEQRWPERPFWRCRHGGRAVAPSAFPTPPSARIPDGDVA
jgi:Cobalamin-independent synthase, Catalytic domain